MPKQTATANDRGRDANRPSEIPPRGFVDVGWRIWEEINEDHILLISAGATFYLILALFPFLTAFVSLYGLVADPLSVTRHAASLEGLLPQGGVDLISRQLQSLASQNQASLGFGFATGIVIALWSANSGVKSLFEGLNAVYDEQERRSFLKLNAISLAFTFGAIFLGIIFLLALGVVPALLAFLSLDRWTEALIRIGRWPILFLGTVAALMLLYRYGPSREPAKLRWLSWGAVTAAILWIVGSWGFSYYLENFADYNATYGSLGAVIGFMVWTWLSVAIMLLGGEINAELEHQTASDSTTGADRSMGSRGAKMADTIGKSTQDQR